MVAGSLGVVAISCYSQVRWICEKLFVSLLIGLNKALQHANTYYILRWIVPSGISTRAQILYAKANKRLRKGHDTHRQKQTNISLALSVKIYRTVKVYRRWMRKECSASQEISVYNDEQEVHRWTRKTLVNNVDKCEYLCSDFQRRSGCEATFLSHSCSYTCLDSVGMVTSNAETPVAVQNGLL